MLTYTSAKQQGRLTAGSLIHTLDVNVKDVEKIDSGGIYTFEWSSNNQTLRYALTIMTDISDFKTALEKFTIEN